MFETLQNEAQEGKFNSYDLDGDITFVHLFDGLYENTNYRWPVLDMAGFVILCVWFISIQPGLVERDYN